MLEWLRYDYGAAWKRTLGREFDCLAPLHSMASTIGGFTLQVWGEVPIKDARGTVVCSRSREKDDLHFSMLSKFGTLRFFCIDEAEAIGAETAGKLESNVRRHIGAQYLVRYTGEGKDARARKWAGVNTLCFWEIGGSSDLRGKLL